ncbi:hypothetical protein Tco_1408730 [Tanacetum coccineum]
MNRYGYSSIGRFDVFFRNQLLVFQQHQDESLYDSWTRFKDVIQKVPNHGLSIWTLIEIFIKHLDSLSRHIINLTVEWDIWKFSDIGAWYAIDDCTQYDKQCSNLTIAIFDETIANPNAQIVGDDKVRVHAPRCMAWLDYDEHVDSLRIHTARDLSEEVEKTLGTPIEVEPLNEIKLEQVGLNFNHNTPFSSREVLSFNGSEPQPLLDSPSLDVRLGDERGPEPPIKPHSSDCFRMKVVYNLTIHTPPSPYVESFHHKDMYCYYHLCIDDPKKHYGFKLGLITHSGSLSVDFSNLEMIKNDWGLESMEVSFLGRGLSLPVKPKELEKSRIKETHHLEPILQQQNSQCMAPSHHRSLYRYYHPHLTLSVGKTHPLRMK